MQLRRLNSEERVIVLNSVKLPEVACPGAQWCGFAARHGRASIPSAEGVEAILSISKCQGSDAGP